MQVAAMNTNRTIPQDITISTSLLPEALAWVWSEKLVPVIHSAPGMAKSAIVAQAAALVGLPLFTYRLAQREPTTIAGALIPDRERGTVRYMLDENFPSAALACILFLDELNRAPALTQNASFGLIDERRIGSVTLHEDSLLVVAVNDVADGGGVIKMPQALNNRVVHVWLTPDIKSWQMWALDNDMPAELIAYLGNSPSVAYQYSKTDEAYPTFRSWAMAGRLFKRGLPSALELPLLAGCVGRSQAIDFLAFARAFKNMPDINSIRLNPDTVAIPTEPSIRYATAYFMAEGWEDRDSRAFTTYLERLGEEYGVFSVKYAERRVPALGTNQYVTAWKLRHQDAF